MLNKSHLSKPADDPDAIHDNVAGEINAITAKTAPADADIFLIEDSAASWIKKKLSWSNIKATLLAYFNTTYARKGANADITSMTALTQITRATGGAFDIAIGGASGDDFTIAANKLIVEGDTGRVGVGTPAPDAKLEIYNGNLYITSMTGDPELRFRVVGVPNPVTKFSLGVDESDVSKFKIGRINITDNTRLTIDTSGNIGIATTSPGEKLEVSGNIHLSSDNDKIYLGADKDIEMSYDGTQLLIENKTSNKDIKFKINDGGVTKDVMRLGGSEQEIQCNNKLKIVGNNASYPLVRLYSYSDTGWHGIFWSMYRFRGTSGSKAAVVSGNNVFSFDCWGYDGSNNIRTAQLVNAIDGAVSAGIVPSQWYFKTMDAAGNYAARMYLKPDGRMSLSPSSPATSAHLDLVSTTGALLLTRMTTIQRDALTPVNGMMLYNSTLNKFQGYENGAWTSLI